MPKSEADISREVFEELRVQERVHEAVRIRILTCHHGKEFMYCHAGCFRKHRAASELLNSAWMVADMAIQHHLVGNAKHAASIARDAASIAHIAFRVMGKDY